MAFVGIFWRTSSMWSFTYLELVWLARQFSLYNYISQTQGRMPFLAVGNSTL